MRNKRNKKNQMKGRKKIYIKMWLEHLLAFIMIMCGSLIVMSIDSQWTLQYLQFVLFNAFVCVVCYQILKHFGRYYLKDLED